MAGHCGEYDLKLVRSSFGDEADVDPCFSSIVDADQCHSAKVEQRFLKSRAIRVSLKCVC